MPKKKKRPKERSEKTSRKQEASRKLEAPRKKEAPKAEGKPSFSQGTRFAFRIAVLALFPFADVFQRANLEWLALVLLLCSALILYEMLDFYRKIRHWRAFFLSLAFYILGFGSLMLAISFHLSWAHSSNIAFQILFTLPRLAAAYYLCQMLRQIYPYR